VAPTSIRWRQRATNLQDDGIEVLIDQEIEAEQFETVGQRHERAELTYTVTHQHQYTLARRRRSEAAQASTPESSKGLLDVHLDSFPDRLHRLMVAMIVTR
jgi:hypothetical protein